MIALVALAGAAVIKMGTLAPEGSVWHRALLEMDEAIRAATQGQVKLKIYAGGVMGDEVDMVRKIRLGQLNAAAFTGVGLGEIVTEARVFQIPGFIADEAELDYLRDQLRPRLDGLLLEKGYVSLAWGDAGWVHFFSTVPIRAPGDLRKHKLWVWSADSLALDEWKKNGVHALGLQIQDILPGLQSGMFQVFANTPLSVLSFQFFTHAKYMNDFRWAVLPGAVIVSKGTFAKLPDAQRAAVLREARRTADKLLLSVRSESARAVTAMQQRGLTVTQTTAAEKEEWRKLAEGAWPRVRKDYIPTAIFDEAVKLRDAYRAARAAKK